MSNRSKYLYADTVLDQVEIRIKELSALLIEKKAALRNAPEGSLRIAQSGKRIQYYHKTGDGNSQGKYLPRKMDKLAAALAQKDYDQKLVKEIEKELEALNRLKKNYNPKEITRIYEEMHTNRQNLVNPNALNDDDFEKNWLSFEYEGLPVNKAQPYFLTRKNERVRSKSQALIADLLNELEIPYRYDFPLLIKNGKGFSSGTLVYAQFYCLNLRTRKEYVWENFSDMDNPSEAKKAVERVSLYNSHNYICGDNLITTMETSEQPLSEEQIKNIAQKFLK